MINTQTQHCDVQIMVAGLIITLFRIIPKLQCLGFIFRPISRFAVLCPYHIRSNSRTDLDVLRVTSTTSTALCTPRVLNKCTEALINLITIRKTSTAMHRETMTDNTDKRPKLSAFSSQPGQGGPPVDCALLVTLLQAD